MPKPLRDELGFAPGMELDLDAVDGRLEIAVPSRASVAQGPHGVRFVAEGDKALTAEQVRALTERNRR